MNLKEAVARAIEENLKIKRADEVWHYYFDGRVFRKVTGHAILDLDDPDNADSHWELVEEE